MAIPGVTKENYSQLAITFMEMNGGSGFIVCRRECPIHGQSELGKATPGQWAAWRAYFARLGVPTRIMDSRDYYTVPAEWPHLFDAMATVGDDHEAARNFASHRDGNRSTAVLSTQARKAAVSNRLGYDPSKRRGVWKPEPESESPLKYVDKDLLLECYETDKAANDARQAMRREKDAA